MSTAPLDLLRLYKGARLLVLGGTGFLGKVWVSMLLKGFELDKLYLVVRPKKGQTPEQRFWREIASSPVFDPLRAIHGEGFEAFMKAKVTPVAGEVSEPYAGIPEDVRNELRGTLSAIVNVAGVVEFMPPLDYALNSNAFGMQNLVQMAKDLGSPPLLHTSTCYVAGDRTGQVDEVDPLEFPFPKADSLDKSHWDPDREIAECVDLVSNVRHRSNDAFRQSAFLDQAKTNLERSGEPARGSTLADEVAKVKRKYEKDHLVDAGFERAKYWGWHNVYTYTKSIGEQILRRSGLTHTIARPAVIESSMSYPRPGWNEGIQTSAPLIYLAFQGPIVFPAKPESVLDVIPVDMVAAGMILVLAELMEGTHKVVYQLGSSDTSPLKMYRFIELTGLYRRKYVLDGKDGGNPLTNWFRARIEPLPSTVAEYDTYGPRPVGKLLKAVAPVAGPFKGGLRGASQGLENSARIVDQFIPFMCTHNYRFSTVNARNALARVPEAQRELAPFYPDTIEWRRYLMEVHTPGIVENVFPEIEAKLDKPVRPLRAHDTVVDMLDEIAEQHDLAPALLRTEADGFSRLSFRGLRQCAHACALRLHEMGVRKGDRVILSGLNHPDWVVCWFGIARLGAIVVPVDPAMAAEPAGNVFRASGAVVAILDEKSRGSFGSAITCPKVDIHDMAARGEVEGLPAQDVHPNDVASILFTSGTTGVPKGVMLTHKNLCSMQASLAKLFPLTSKDRMLSVLPLHHTFEFSCGLLLPLSRGARVIYLDELNGDRLTYGLQEGRVTALAGVPALWQLLERRIRSQVKERGDVFETVVDVGLEINRTIGKNLGFDVGKGLFAPIHSRLGGNIRYLVSGGSALPPQTQEFFQGLGLHLAEGYGLTESSPVLTFAQAKPGAKGGHVGKPVPGVDVKIINPDKDGIGEIIARGPNVMAGYFENAEATAAAIDKDGWLHTGDLGRMDGKGRLHIMGRAKEVVVSSSGENIYLDDVENTLGPDIPYVKEYTLVGIADPRGGERLAMLAVPGGDMAGDLDRHTLHSRAKEALKDAVNKRLPAFQRPAVIHLVDADLPRTATRKVKRKEVAKVVEKIVAATPEKTVRNVGVAGPVAHAIAGVAGVAQSEVTPSTRMVEDLHFDSLMWVELASALEGFDGGRPDADTLSKCETVNDVVELVKAPKPTIVEEEDVRDKFHIPDVVAAPMKEVLGWAQREAYGTGLKTTVYGRAHIPQNRQVIVVSNHCSHLDMGLVKYALGPYGRQLVALAAKDYFFEGNKFLVAYFEQLTNLRPIDRKRGFRASLEQATDVVREGNVVLIFPEGTRRTDGAIGEFKPLVGWLALESGVDILPLHLDGTFEALPKGAVLPRGRDVSVRIGPALRIEDLRRLTEGQKTSTAARIVTMLSQQAVEALRDGTVLDISTLKPADVNGEPERPKTVADAFATLEGRVDPEKAQKAQSWYFTLGGDGGARYTVIVEGGKAQVVNGRPPSGKADCVVKTSEEMMKRIILEGYTPEPAEFFSGTIKTSDIPLLIEFSQVFRLSEVAK